ncbi:MAG TPA: hypothetical protein VF532_23780 [Candidatus Angelobacter sp.]
MNDWAPWRITCNLVRAFFPTLSILLCWDLCRNLTQATPAKPLSIMTDAVALGAVLAVRLARFAGAREQIKQIFHWSPASGLGICALLVLLLRNPLDALLAAAGYVLYADISRVCKLSRRQAVQAVEFICIACAISAGVASNLVSGLEQIRQGTFSWQDGRDFAVLILILAGILVLGWRWRGREELPVIQELRLNR